MKQRQEETNYNNSHSPTEKMSKQTKINANISRKSKQKRFYKP